MLKSTVVLIHGLWMTGLEMALLQRRLRDSGFRAVRYRYGTISTGLDQNLRQLQNFLAGFAAQSCAEPLHLVGHSLGGVVALHLLNRYPDLPVDKVICLGSPLRDSSAARKTREYALGRRMVGKTLTEAVLERPLNSWTGPQRVGSIAGTRPLGFSHRFTKIAAPNDGMVVVAETELPGIADHLVLPVSHTGLVFDKAVAEQSAWFLRHGEFRHELT